MTRNEAKKRMEICRDFLANNYSDMGEPNFMAFNMAIKALEKKRNNTSDMLSDIYMVGVNMTGEYHGCWVRFKDIEMIIEKYMEVEE